MSAAEKLKVLERSRGENPTAWAEAVNALDDALPEIIAVVEAAERGRERSVLIEEHVSTIEKVAWRVDDAQALNFALSALDEALSDEGVLDIILSDEIETRLDPETGKFQYRGRRK